MLHQKLIFIFCYPSLLKIFFKRKNLIARSADKNHRTFRASWRKNSFKTNFVMSKFYSSLNNRILAVYCYTHYSSTGIYNSCSGCLVKENAGIVFIHTDSFYDKLTAMTYGNISNISVINKRHYELHIIFKVTKPFILLYTFVQIIHGRHQSKTSPDFS